MAWFIRKPDDLILNRGAVPGTDPLDLAAVQGGSMEIAQNNLFGPVSYTHLDVYKRQGFTFFRC